MRRPPHDGKCEPICEWCATVAAEEINLLPVDYFDLKRDCARPAGFSETKIARPHPAGIEPIDLHSDELCADIAWTLTVWEPPVREAARLGAEAVRGVRPGYAVTVAARLLAAHVHVLAALPPQVGYADGLDAGPVLRTGRDGIDRLRALHARARTRLGVTRRIFQLPGECSKCARWALRRQDGGDTVWCAHCRQTWTYDDYCKYVNLTTAALGAT